MSCVEEFHAEKKSRTYALAPLLGGEETCGMARLETAAVQETVKKVHIIHLAQVFVMFRR